MTTSSDKSKQIILTLQRVPKGKVVSYGQLADLAGLPGRARMVGKVLREYSGALPWYRVLKSSGQIAFDQDSPQGKAQRMHLLDEGVLVVGNRVDMKKYQWQPMLAELLQGLDF